MRNGTRVWAWNARTLSRMLFDFGADLVAVKLIEGGILAFSAITAAIYDSYLGEWLPELRVPGGALTEGDAQAASG